MEFSITSLRLNSQSWERSASAMVVNDHDSHPDMGHLILLVFEAVMQVVCVALPGYIIARLGYFDADKQKFLANLNVMLFTPCLIFTKLASQLNADKLVELGIIPIIFVIQTLVSLLASRIVTKSFGFGRRASNFVTAMGVFGNSNSLPISLVLSLSQTLRGLHWDKIPGDNDDEVAARGILYLLIFQQLGQLVRWSWGYHVLLAPKSKYEEYETEIAEEGRYRDEPETLDETDHAPKHHNILISDLEDGESDGGNSHFDSDHYEPAGRTPVAGASRASPADSEDEGTSTPRRLHKKKTTILEPFPDIKIGSTENISSFPRIHSTIGAADSAPRGLKGYWIRAKKYVTARVAVVSEASSRFMSSTCSRLPAPVQILISSIAGGAKRVYGFLWDFMNPPLWAMLIAITIASIPDLQRLFFQEGSFVKNSVTSAIKSSGGVAVPLILVVLGANLARNTESQSEDDEHDPEEERIGTKLLVASLVSRMLIPSLIMAPILALIAKCVPVSILDDPIFIVVCFLLVGAPSALQLAQICQINMVFENVMARILFQSYVIWILPSTLVLVMCALEVLEWAR